MCYPEKTVKEGKLRDIETTQAGVKVTTGYIISNVTTLLRIVWNLHDKSKASKCSTWSIDPKNIAPLPNEMLKLHKTLRPLV